MMLGESSLKIYAPGLAFLITYTDESCDTPHATHDEPELKKIKSIFKLWIYGTLL